MVLLQWLSCVCQAISEKNVFLCGGIMDKNLGLTVLVECLDKGGMFLMWICFKECLIALIMVLLSF